MTVVFLYIAINVVWNLYALLYERGIERIFRRTEYLRVPHIMRQAYNATTCSIPIDAYNTSTMETSSDIMPPRKQRKIGDFFQRLVFSVYETPLRTTISNPCVLIYSSTNPKRANVSSIVRSDGSGGTEDQDHPELHVLRSLREGESSRSADFGESS